MRFSERVRMDRSEAILDAASRLAGRQGWSAVTIDAVAREAGVAKGTVYLHHAGREALLIALGQRAAREITTVIQEEAARAADPMGLLHASFQRLVADLAPNGSLPTLLHSCACLKPGRRSASEAVVGPLLDVLTERIRDAQARTALSGDIDARAAAAAFLALAAFPAWMSNGEALGASGDGLWPIYERALTPASPR